MDEAEYRELVGGVVEVHRDEIEADLARARAAVPRAAAQLAKAQRQVAVFEGLLALAGHERSDAVDDAKGGLTLHDAMVRVLRDDPVGMMRAGDLTAEINRRSLYRMRDGRPVEAQQIHARAGNYPQLFGREGTFIKLADVAGPPVA